MQYLRIPWHVHDAACVRVVNVTSVGAAAARQRRGAAGVFGPPAADPTAVNFSLVGIVFVAPNFIPAHSCKVLFPRFTQNK